MNTELQFKITLLKPTPEVDFALQKGSGNAYQTIQKQNVDSGDINFLFPVIVKGNREIDSMPKLSGPFVHGPANGKFTYIDIGTYAGQTGTVWGRRLKIPLSDIGWEMVDQLSTKPGLILATKVPGTGKDGGPNCATVKPFEGWEVVGR